MALETNETWDDLMIQLKVEFNDLKDKRCWRDVNIIQKLPLFETKFHSKYYGYAAEIYHWLKNKGGKDSLVITDKAAYIVDVPGKKVVTAIDKESIESNVFTKIDSTVLV